MAGDVPDCDGGRQGGSEQPWPVYSGTNGKARAVVMGASKYFLVNGKLLQFHMTLQTCAVLSFPSTVNMQPFETHLQS